MSGALRAALALFALTLILGFWLMLNGAPAFDPLVTRTLAVQRTQTGSWLMVTNLGDWQARLGVGLAAAGWLAFRRDRAAALILLSVVAVQTMTNSGLKLLFARARPDLLDHLDAVRSLSYPSGHSAQTATLFLLIALLIDRRLLWLAVPLALLVGASRVVLGVHWPSDVLGGLLEGTAFALIGLHLSQNRSLRAKSRSTTAA